MVIGFIGLGEVGGYYSTGLAAGGATVKGFDMMMGKPELAERFRGYSEKGVKLVNSTQELIAGSDIVIAVTTARVAKLTAESAKPFLRPGQIYVELNSAVPKVKQEIEAFLEGIDMVDGTTMASANMSKHKTPIGISGKRGEEVSNALNSFGMNTSYVGDQVGQAAAVKTLRSIFMKGFEAVLMECMTASYAYDVQEQVYSSILSFFEGKSMDSILKMLVTTDAIHAKRRGEEVAAVADMLEEAGINNIMSRAAAGKLEWLSSLGLDEAFEHTVPEQMTSVLKKIADR